MAHEAKQRIGQLGTGESGARRGEWAVSSSWERTLEPMDTKGERRGEGLDTAQRRSFPRRRACA